MLNPKVEVMYSNQKNKDIKDANQLLPTLGSNQELSRFIAAYCHPTELLDKT